MKEIEVIDNKHKALMYLSFDKNGIPLPFTKEILLIECHIAGTSHYNAKEIEPLLKKDDFLIFKREPENPYDKFAISIFTENNKKIGYIPKEKNEILARLMDAGKFVFGKIISKEWINNWLKVKIKVFMREF